MKKTRVLLLSTLLSGIVFAQAVFAGPADYVYTPTVEYGEREIDFKFGTGPLPDGTRNQVTRLGYGYTPTEIWFTELYFNREIEGSDKLTVAEWENKFQLTETGKYGVDVGLIAELEAPVNNANAPYTYRFGPLFQTEFGKLQLNGNLLFGRAFGRANESGVPFSTNFAYQWQAKYRWQPVLEFGVQGFGEMGKWNDWDKQANQNHRIGPAIFGKFALGNRQAIKYNTAWLLGASNAAPKHTLRMQAEYEF